MNSVHLPTNPNRSERTSTMQAIVTQGDEERACSTIPVALRGQLDCARQPNLQILSKIGRRNVVSLSPPDSEARQNEMRRFGVISSTRVIEHSQSSRSK